MAYTFPAMVAWDPTAKTGVFNTVWQVYATTDTSFTTPLAITDAFGNPLTGNNLNSGAQGILPQFQQATNASVVIRDLAGRYAWTVIAIQPPTQDSAIAGFINDKSSSTSAAIRATNTGVWQTVISPSGADDTAALRTAMGTAGASIYIKSGNYTISGTVTIAPNVSVTCHPQAVIKLANMARCWMFQTDATIADNGRISWIGGTIDGNDENQGDETADGNAYDVSKGLVFSKVTNLEVAHVKVRHVRGQAINHWNCVNVYAHHLIFEQVYSSLGAGRRRDGITGMSTNIIIENVSGFTDDDMVAVCAGAKWGTGGQTGGQDVTSAVIRGVNAQADPTNAGNKTTAAVSCYVFNGNNMDNLTIDQVTGETDYAHLRICSYLDTGTPNSTIGGTFRTVNISNISGYSKSYNTPETFMRFTSATFNTVNISNVVRRIPSFYPNAMPGTIYLTDATIVDLNISNLASFDETTPQRAVNLIEERGASAISNVHLNNISHYQTAYPANKPVIYGQANTGTVTTTIHAPAVSPARLAVISGTSKITHLTNQDLDNTDTGWQTLTLNSGWTTGGTALQARKIGSQVFLKGNVVNTTASTTYSAVATLPAGFAPPSTFNLPQSTNDPATMSMQIKSDGTINMYSSAVTTSWRPANTSYMVN